VDLTPSPDQEALLAATVEWCRAAMPLEHARDRPQGLWRELDAMGWLGMTAPSMGLDHATEALVFAELGRHVAPVAMISTAVARRWTTSEDKVALCLISGRVARVFDAEGAQTALAWQEGAAVSLAWKGAAKASPGLDPSASLSRFDPAPETITLDDSRAGLHLQLLTAAFALGCADAATDMAVDYAKLREQFERPIGWFQALKHLCADMAVRCAVARSQLYYAACALDADEPDATFHIAAAKRLADQAALDNGRGNIQVHGGIGMTDEAYPHLCLKRAHLLSFIAPVANTALLGESA